MSSHCCSSWQSASVTPAAGRRERRRPTAFVAGLVTWALATTSVIAVYAPVLFWMRALQVLILLFVVPFLLALGRPVATLRAALSESGRARLDRLLASRTCRVVLSPLCTSAAMLGLPWLLYLTPWYTASMGGAAGSLTRIVLSIVGFGYFYTRLQKDPVPRRYSPLLSIGSQRGGVTRRWTVGSGAVVGPVIAYGYYAALHRDWGPSMRTDQTVGAGILWIVATSSASRSWRCSCGDCRSTRRPRPRRSTPRSTARPARPARPTRPARPMPPRHHALVGGRPPTR